jgi:hypothetical protein
VRELFVCGLGLIYCIAFLSLWVQLSGLYGSEGILPVTTLMENIELEAVISFWDLPTVFWLGRSDLVLHFFCALGFVASICLMLGWAPFLMTVTVWGIYLSFVSVGQVFLNYQWDALLLETGLVAFFLVPMRWGRYSRSVHLFPIAGLVTVRLLLFKLMFLSFVVKMMARNGAWTELFALDEHFQTQPIPAWTSWYAHNYLPGPVKKLGVMFALFVEGVLPFFIFGPRKFRLVACVGIALLMGLISLTGNFGFFNALTLLLCIWLIDDKIWKKILPKGWVEAHLPAESGTGPDQGNSLWIRRMVWVPVVLIISLSFIQGMSRVGYASQVPGWMNEIRRAAVPFRSINSYGLFQSMTLSRPEILVLGSEDGENWLTYDFSWKPDDLQQQPGLIQPHMPRLDWQMWFAALRGNCRRTGWYLGFAKQLLEGSESVDRLLQSNPFEDQNPRYIRSLLFEYRFSSVAERRTTGQWWVREELGVFCPELTLRDGELNVVTPTL